MQSLTRIQVIPIDSRPESVVTITLRLLGVVLPRKRSFLDETSRGWDMGVDELLKANREEILRLASKYGARNVRIFGSVARGEAGPESDVDILVDLEPGRSLFDLGGLLMDLRDLLGC